MHCGDSFFGLEVVDPLKVDLFIRRRSQTSRVQGAALRRAVIGSLLFAHATVLSWASRLSALV